MSEAQELFDTYFQVAKIYSGTGVKDKDILDAVRTTHQDLKTINIEDAFQYHLKRRMNVPIEHGNEILGLGRRLSRLEVEVLDLKKKVEKSGEERIYINIVGLETI